MEKFGNNPINKKLNTQKFGPQSNPKFHDHQFKHNSMISAQIESMNVIKFNEAFTTNKAQKHPNPI